MKHRRAWILAGALAVIVLSMFFLRLAEFVPAPIEGRFMFKDFKGGALSLGPDYSYYQFRDGKLIFYSSDGPPVVGGA